MPKLFLFIFILNWIVGSFGGNYLLANELNVITRKVDTQEQYLSNPIKGYQEINDKGYRLFEVVLFPSYILGTSTYLIGGNVSRTFRGDPIIEKYQIHFPLSELKFPLYEHHTRVPLIIKQRKDINNHESKIINYPVSSQIMSFIEILKSQNF